MEVRPNNGGIKKEINYKGNKKTCSRHRLQVSCLCWSLTNNFFDDMLAIIESII
jgi:hypothetical protein